MASFSVYEPISTIFLMSGKWFSIISPDYYLALKFSTEAGFFHLAANPPVSQPKLSNPDTILRPPTLRQVFSRIQFQFTTKRMNIQMNGYAPDNGYSQTTENTVNGYAPEKGESERACSGICIKSK